MCSREEPLGTDTKLDWCGDALCGMGVIRSPSRLISNNLQGGTAGPWLSAKNNDSDGTELVLPGIASQVKRLWRRVGMKGDRRAL